MNTYQARIELAPGSSLVYEPALARNDVSLTPFTPLEKARAFHLDTQPVGKEKKWLYEKDKFGIGVPFWGF